MPLLIPDDRPVLALWLDEPDMDDDRMIAVLHAGAKVLTALIHSCEDPLTLECVQVQGHKAIPPDIIQEIYKLEFPATLQEVNP